MTEKFQITLCHQITHTKLQFLKPHQNIDNQ